jgi:hypothetical protein
LPRERKVIDKLPTGSIDGHAFLITAHVRQRECREQHNDDENHEHLDERESPLVPTVVVNDTVELWSVPKLVDSPSPPPWPR